MYTCMPISGTATIRALASPYTWICIHLYSSCMLISGAAATWALAFTWTHIYITRYTRMLISAAAATVPIAQVPDIQSFAHSVFDSSGISQDRVLTDTSCLSVYPRPQYLIFHSAGVSPGETILSPRLSCYISVYASLRTSLSITFYILDIHSCAHWPH